MSYSSPVAVTDAATIGSSALVVGDAVDIGVITRNYIIWAYASTTDASLEGPLSFDFQGSIDGTHWYSISGGSVDVVSDTAVELPDNWSMVSAPAAPGTPVRFLRTVGVTNEGNITASAYYAIREEL